MKHAHMKAIIWLLLPLYLSAQHFHTQTYSQEQGLPSSLIMDLTQDEKGYIWAATRSGVARYDGAQWHTFNINDGLPTLFFKSIVPDGYGGILVGNLLHPVPIFQWNGKKWRPIEGPPVEPFAMEPFGLEVLKWDGQVVYALLYGECGLFLYKDGRWEYDEGSAGKIKKIRTLNNQLYAFHHEGFYTLGANGRDTSLCDLLPPERRLVLGAFMDVEGENSTLWVKGRDWLGRLAEGQFELLGKVPPISDSIVEMVSDGYGGVIFGGVNSLFHYDNMRAKLRALGKHDGFAGEGGNTLFRDRENNVWVGNMRGITKISSMRFFNYCEREGLAELEVSALLPLDHDLVVVGHNAGMSIFHKDKFWPLSMTDISLPSITRVMDLEPHGTNTFWAALSGLGVRKYRLEIGADGPVLADEITMRFKDPQERSYSLGKSREGILFVGTNRGIKRVKNNQLVADSSSSPSGVRRLHRGKSGRLFAATESHGLMEYTKGQWQVHPAWDKNYGEIYTLLEDREGTLVLGTLNGLLQVTKNRILPYLRAGKGVNRPVFLLFMDADQHLWVGTDQGIFRFNGHTWQHFMTRDGLSGSETNRDAGFGGTDGHVWIGTDQGLSMYHPLRDHQPAPPLIEVGDIEVNGRVMKGSDLSQLNYDQSDLVFSFRILGFNNEATTRYSCRLEGYDETWLPAVEGGNRKTRYTNLTAGRYRFHVKGAHTGGSWSDVASSEWIVIEKEFWKSLWFRALVFVICVVFLLSIIGFATSHRLSLRLEEQVNQRTQALQQKIQEHQQAQVEIQALNEQLEARVEARTTQLKEAQKDLVETAHRAGMAEIATSMLHNVGNILNSLGTSGFFLKEALEKSALTSFLKANELLAAHENDLEAFVRDHPKGKQLLKFYLSLGNRLQREQGQMNEHLNQLMDKLGTIKDVVAQQHNYASGVYQSELIDLKVLVESSLKILGSAIENRGIEVTTQFSEVPPVVVRKTRLVHTLVNLIKNAAESIDVAQPETGRIHIATNQEDDWVLLRIQDNGMGVSSDLKEKIFRHGYSTKSTGMGFGLHSCANAMREMDGSICVESKGDHCGATFILRFPTHALEADETKKRPIQQKL